MTSVLGLDKMMTRSAQSLAFVAITTLITSTANAAEPSLLDQQGASFTPFPTVNFQPGPSLSTLNNADYVLGPGDQIQLAMYGQTDLFGTTPYTVLVDGTVSLPFIGRIPVAGKTVREVEADVTNQYKRFFKRPYLTVVLTKPRQLTLGVSGEVVKPGTYAFAGTDGAGASGGGQIPTVTQLLKLAGGVTPSSDLRNIEIRRSKFGQPENYETVSINLMKLIQDGDISQDIRLRDGDIVIVKASEKPSLKDFMTAVNSSFATDNTQPLKVAVVGEVFRPGSYTLSAGNTIVQSAGIQGVTTNSTNSKVLPTVSQAIQTAGGIKPEADIRSVQVRRIARSGAEQLLAVDLRKLALEGDVGQDIPLQEGDTVVVSKAKIPLTPEEQQFLADTTFSPATIDVNVVGEVPRPGFVKIKPNTPLNTAVMAAGGLITTRSSKKNVRLIRVNPDGTVTQRKIDIDFEAKIDEEKNPALRNNDLVVVGRRSLTALGDDIKDTIGNISALLSPLTIFRIFTGF